MRFALTLTGLALALLPSCKSAEEVQVVLKDQCNFQGTANYTEFVVFAGQCGAGSTECGLDDQLSVGDTTGATFRAIVPMGDPLPSVGKLDQGSYAFGAIVRDDSCRVVGYGCTCADISVIREVQVQPGAWNRCAGKDCSLQEFCAPLESGGCTDGLACTAGECRGEPTEVDGGDEPTGCTLEVLASGPLPSVTEETRVSGPALAATDSGFTLAYRTQDIEGLTDIVAPLPSVDGALSVVPPAKRACSFVDVQAEGGIGIGFGNGAGVAVFSHPDCDGAGAGATFTAFNSAGVPGAVVAQPNPSATSLTLAPHHSLAPRPAAGEWDFVFRWATGADQTSVTLVKGGKLVGAPINKLFDAMDYVMVARGKSIVSYLGSAATSTTLLVGAPTTATADMTVVASDAVDVATISALGDQLLFARSTTTGGGLSWDIYGADAQSVDAGVIGSATYFSGVSSWFRDAPLVAAGSSDHIDVHWIGGETTFVEISSATAPLAGFSGELLASASGEDQVAVAWLNDATVTTGSLGGWAVLGCASADAGSESGSE